MKHLFSNAELTEICAHVFEEQDLSQTEVSIRMGVSQTAVSYMINDPGKSMSDLRKRFLRQVADIEIEGPGYFIDDSESSVSLDEV